MIWAEWNGNSQQSDMKMLSQITTDKLRKKEYK